MKDQPTNPTKTTLPPRQARASLKAALRQKRQRIAPIIVRLENELHTFSLEGWCDYVYARSKAEHKSFQASDGRLLGILFADCTAWDANDYALHLACLQTLETDAARHQHADDVNRTTTYPLAVLPPSPENLDHQIREKQDPRQNPGSM